MPTLPRDPVQVHLAQQDKIVDAALVAGGACLVMYAIIVVVLLGFAWKTQLDAANKVAGAMPDGGNEVAPGISDGIAKILSSLPAVIESLKSAGPVVTSMVGAIAFFVIALAASGSLGDETLAPGRPAAVPKTDGAAGKA